MVSAKEILKLIEKGESATLEFKDSRILSDPFKLAKVMTAFANAEGGILLIGIKDDGSIEGMKAKKGHEEHIMNIASEKCDPPLTPRFEKISVPNEGDIYFIQIPERQGPYHAVKTKEGYKFFVRVGSTIRERTPSQLGLGEQGVEIPAESLLEKFLCWLGRSVLKKFYGRLDANILKLQIIIAIVSSLLIVIPFLLLFKFQNGALTIVNYPIWVNFIFIISWILGIVLLQWLAYIPKTRCPICKSHFSFRAVKKWVFEKRQIKEGLEEWKTRTLKRCDKCGYEQLSKLQYEKIEV